MERNQFVETYIGTEHNFNFELNEDGTRADCRFFENEQEGARYDTISIAELERVLNEFKQKGANRVFIVGEEDGYGDYKLAIHATYAKQLLTPAEIKELEIKAMEARIEEMKVKLIGYETQRAHFTERLNTFENMLNVLKA